MEYHGSKETVDKIIDVTTQLEPPRQAKVYNFSEHQLEEQNKVKKMLKLFTNF